MARISPESLRPELSKLQHAVRGISDQVGLELRQPRALIRDGYIEVAETSGGGERGASLLRLALEPSAEEPLSLRLRVVEGSPNQQRVAKVAQALLEGILPAEASQPAPRLSWPSDATRSTITARPSHHELSQNGLLVHGALERREQPPPVVAEFSVLRLQNSTNLFTLDASRSWAPGSEVVRLDWDFGDGTGASSSDTNIALVEQHAYQADGHYQVTLTVSDARGRRGESTQLISVGTLQLHVLPPVLGEFIATTAILLTSVSTPVEGARVVISANGFEPVDLSTDADGMSLLERPWALLIQDSPSGMEVPFGTEAQLSVDSNVGRGEWPVWVVTYEVLQARMECIQLCDDLLADERLEVRIGSPHTPEMLRETKSLLLSGVIPSWLSIGPAPTRGDRAINQVRKWLESTAETVKNRAGRLEEHSL